MNETLPPPTSPETEASETTKPDNFWAGLLLICAITAASLLFWGGLQWVEANNDDQPSVAVEAKRNTNATSQSEDGTDSLYMKIFRSSVSFESVTSDFEAIEFGLAFCERLNSGVRLDDVLFAAFMESEQMANDMAAIAGLAIPTFCPEHLWQLGS